MYGKEGYEINIFLSIKLLFAYNTVRFTQLMPHIVKQFRGWKKKQKTLKIRMASFRQISKICI